MFEMIHSSLDALESALQNFETGITNLNDIMGFAEFAHVPLTFIVFAYTFGHDDMYGFGVIPDMDNGNREIFTLFKPTPDLLELEKRMALAIAQCRYDITLGYSPTNNTIIMDTKNGSRTYAIKYTHEMSPSEYELYDYIEYTAMEKARKSREIAG